jgi:hypothetical protein
MPEAERDPDLPAYEREHMKFMADHLTRYL